MRGPYHLVSSLIGLFCQKALIVKLFQIVSGTVAKVLIDYLVFFLFNL